MPDKKKPDDFDVTDSLLPGEDELSSFERQLDKALKDYKASKNTTPDKDPVEDRSQDDRHFIEAPSYTAAARTELDLLRAEGQLYMAERAELLAILREDWRKKETMFHLGGVVSLEITPLTVPKDSRVGMMLCRKDGNVFLGDIVNEPAFGWTWFYQGLAYPLEFKEPPLREHLRFLAEFGIEEGLKVTVEEDRTLRLSYPATAEEMISAWLI